MAMVEEHIVTVTRLLDRRTTGVIKTVTTPGLETGASAGSRRWD
jgi:hypothetical protein